MANDDFYDDSETPTKLIELVGEAITDTIAWIFFVASVLAVLFGIMSWSALNKFRTFRNYVLISALIANMLLALIMRISDRFMTEEAVENNPALQIIPLALFVFLQMVYQCWLLVLCYVFCVDFVQVFRYDIRYKYLFSNLFAWGVPFIIVLLYAIVGFVLLKMPDSKDIFVGFTALFVLFIPVALSLITYIAVVCRLFCSASTDKKCKGFTIATLIFTPSNVFIIIMLAGLFEKNVLAVDIIGEILEYLLIIALIVFLVVLKSNWKLWRDFLNKRSAPESGVMLGDQRI